MSNPFFHQKSVPQVDPENPVVIKCKHCNNNIQRSQVDAIWCHADEELLFTGKHVVVSNKYDHAAEPDYIDVESWEVDK